LSQCVIQSLAQLIVLLAKGLELDSHHPTLLPGAINFTMGAILHPTHIGGCVIALLRQLLLQGL
jgi:hypothetical protein